MSAWERCLADQGYRMTAPRRAVLQVLNQAKTPLSPPEILERAQKIHVSLGLVTVYRVVHLLSAMKLVRRVHFESGCHGYLPASPGHHHTIICDHCGCAAEFPGDQEREALEALVAHVRDRTGYQVNDHLLQLSGLCPNCQ